MSEALSEADTCRKFVVPKLVAAGWDNDLYGAYDLHHSGLAYMRMVRTSRWKLVRHFRCDGMNELYDLKNDPDETENLYGSMRVRSQRDGLQLKLDAWRKDVRDPLKE